MRSEGTGLAPREIRLYTNEVQTLVEGQTEWSYQSYEYGNTWHSRSVSLFYKGHIVTNLKRQKHAFVQSDRPAVTYRSLVHAVQTYQGFTSLLRYIERSNREAGLENYWCVERGTRLAQITLTLTQQEVDALTRLAHRQGQALEQLAAHTLQTVLLPAHDQSGATGEVQP